MHIYSLKFKRSHGKLTSWKVFFTICLFREKHHFITIQLLNWLPHFRIDRQLVLASDREIL